MTSPAAGARREWAPRPSEPSRHWVLAKWGVLACYVALVASLALAPEPTTPLFWNVLVPLLPAVFLLNVELWRNVCPLATLNAIRGDDEGQPMTKRGARIAAAIGVGALLVCLPLRRAVLNDDGMATAFVVGGVGVLALLSGLRYQRKAGFCNSVCPVLPVERLYGARPLLVVENARCTPCRACTRSGCIDLGTERSVLQVLGDAAESRTWVLTPFGAFGTAFPGIVAAFYLMPVSAASSLTGATVTIVAGGLVSWALAGLIVACRPVDPTRSLLWAAAVAATIYYWFTVEASAVAFGFSSAVVAALRLGALALVALWLVRGLRRRPDVLVQLSR